MLTSEPISVRVNIRFVRVTGWLGGLSRVWIKKNARCAETQEREEISEIDQKSITFKLKNEEKNNRT